VPTEKQSRVNGYAMDIRWLPNIANGRRFAAAGGH
jgi:hypothetical protein